MHGHGDGCGSSYLWEWTVSLKICQGIPPTCMRLCFEMVSCGSSYSWNGPFHSRYYKESTLALELVVAQVTFGVHRLHS